MRIYTRIEWGAKHADGFGPAPVPASSVWLHHSAGAAGKEDASFDEDARIVRSLEATGQRRFRGGISYTFVVTRSGRVFEGHSIGRRGAHTKGQNTTGRAICLAGNYETLAPTGKQISAVAELLKHGQRNGWWVCPLITGGHQEAPGAATACPGRNLMSSIDDINRAAVTRSPAGSYGTDIFRMVNELAGAAAPVPSPKPEPARESAPPRVTSAPNPAALPLLRRGATGAAVRKLQTKLGVTADGIFGPITERALREFQRKNSLAVDGIVGPLTWARLVR